MKSRVLTSPADTYQLSNGLRVPCLAFGTWHLAKGRETEAILAALEAGYRHLDTAVPYDSEPFVGEAIRRSGIPRTEIFVTTKLWNTQHSYEGARRGLQESLDRLGLDYVDMYLIHWPIPYGHHMDYKEMNNETWCSMEEMYKDGLCLSIGVSNFMTHHLRPLVERADINPMVNQTELHFRYQQDETVHYCRSHGMLLEACFPLLNGDVFDDPLLAYLSRKHGRTVAQICLRWHVQKGYLPIARSSNPLHIRNNLRVFDFELDATDMFVLDAERGKGQCATALHPDDFPEELPDKKVQQIELFSSGEKGRQRQGVEK